MFISYLRVQKDLIYVHLFNNFIFFLGKWKKDKVVIWYGTHINLKTLATPIDTPTKKKVSESAGHKNSDTTTNRWLWFHAYQSSVPELPNLLAFYFYNHRLTKKVFSYSLVKVFTLRCVGSGTPPSLPLSLVLRMFVFEAEIPFSQLLLYSILYFLGVLGILVLMGLID